MSRQNRERRRRPQPGRGSGLMEGVTRWIELTRDGRTCCQLCGGPPATIGLFAPTPELQRRLLAPPGKERWVAFALCGGCLALPDAMDRIDAAMVALADQCSGQVGVN